MFHSEIRLAMHVKQVELCHRPRHNNKTIPRQMSWCFNYSKFMHVILHHTVLYCTVHVFYRTGVRENCFETLGSEEVIHWLINYLDTNKKCRHLKNLPAKGLFGRCLSEFIDWRYSQSCRYFRPSFVNCCPLTFSLVQLPPPPSRCG